MVVGERFINSVRWLDMDDDSSTSAKVQPNHNSVRRWSMSHLGKVAPVRVKRGGVKLKGCWKKVWGGRIDGFKFFFQKLFVCESFKIFSQKNIEKYFNDLTFWHWQSNQLFPIGLHFNLQELVAACPPRRKKSTELNYFSILIKLATWFTF